MLLVGALSLLSLTAGCGVSPAERGGGGAGGGEVLNDYLESGISGLDPATAADSESLIVLGNVNEGLYRLDENGEPVPGMAESVEISDDGLTYTFTLREGVQWSNGDPVTARDFEYAWLRAVDPDTAGEQARLLTDFIEGAADYNEGAASVDEVGVEATGARTLEVTLESPAPFFLDLTTLPIYLPLKESFVELWGEEFAESPDSLLYNGPYQLTGLELDRGMTLQKREDYWDAANVDVETVEGRVAGNPADRYESGALDVATLGAGRIPDYEADEAFERRTEFATFSLYLNDDDPAMGNPSLRKAVQSGFNRESFVDAVLGDGSMPAYGYVPYGMSSGGPGGETFRELAGDTVPAAGTVDARRHWERGVEELGEEPTLTILSGHSSAEREAGAFLRDELEERLGARVEVEVVTPDTLLERAESGEYQILAARWTARYDDPASYLAPWFSGSTPNGLRLGNARYNGLVQEALAEPDAGRRAALLVRAERLLVEEAALVAPVYHSGDAYLVAPGVSGYTTHPYGLPVDYRHVEVER